MSSSLKGPTEFPPPIIELVFTEVVKYGKCAKMRRVD